MQQVHRLSCCGPVFLAYAVRIYRGPAMLHLRNHTVLLSCLHNKDLLGKCNLPGPDGRDALLAFSAAFRVSCDVISQILHGLSLPASACCLPNCLSLAYLKLLQYHSLNPSNLPQGMIVVRVQHALSAYLVKYYTPLSMLLPNGKVCMLL